MEPGRHVRLRWLLVVCLVLFQFLLFRTHVLREVSGTYPRFFDQAHYLSRTYAMFEASLDEGLATQVFSMVWGEHARRPVNGVLVPIEAMLLFNLFGASRLVALIPGLLHYLVWQVTTLLVVRRLSGSLACAATCTALLLTLGSPFAMVGGISDYRFDFPAMCLFGTCVGLVLRSGVYSDRRWSIVSGVAAGLLVLARYLTAAYLLAISVVMLGVLAWGCRRPPSTERGAAARARVSNLMLSGLATVVVAFPSLWRGRQSIYDYYLSPRIDHSVWGGGGLIDGLRTYAVHASVHLTGWFCGAAVVAIAGSVAAGRWASASRRRTAAEPAGAVLFLSIAFLVPLAFLVTYPAQSPAALGIVIPPLAALCSLAVVRAWRHDPGEGAAARWMRYGVVAAVLGAGILNQTEGYARRTLRGDERIAVAEATRMLERAGRFCEEMRWTRPRISVTAVRDDLAGAGLVLAPLYYERHGVLLDVKGKLGESVFEIDEAGVRRALAESDLVFSAPTDGVDVPFNRTIGRLQPVVAEILERDFVLLESFWIRGARLDLYASPQVQVSGASGAWLTRQGTMVAIRRPLLQRGTRVVLRGRCATQIPCDLPAVARPASPGRERVVLPIEATSDGGLYELRIALPDDAAAWGEDPLLLRVTFERFFVPARDGTSDDVRELAAWAPTEAKLEHSAAR